MSGCQRVMNDACCFGVLVEETEITFMMGLRIQCVVCCLLLIVNLVVRISELYTDDFKVGIVCVCLKFESCKSLFV